MSIAENFKRPRYIEAIALIVIGIIMVVQQFYQSNKDADQDAKLAAAVAANTALTTCLAEVVQDITTTTSVRSEAAEARDEAELKKEAAMYVVMNGRVIEGQNQNDMILNAAREWKTQYKEWVFRSRQLDEARESNPPPNYRDFCPKVVVEK